MVFLLAIHIGKHLQPPTEKRAHDLCAGTAVPFTLYGVRFSCKIFGESVVSSPLPIRQLILPDTQLTCKIVDLAFLATAWSITGLRE